MLLIWTTPTRWTEPLRPRHHQTHSIALADDPAALDKLLDHIAARARKPLAVTLYAGHHYHDEPDRWDDARHIPAHPSDRPQPELTLTLGADTTPLHWTSADGRKYTSQSPASDNEPGFRYLDGGHEAYAPAWSLIPVRQARDALREFHQAGGHRPRNTTWQQT
jgi:Immunity protein Imm1